MRAWFAVPAVRVLSSEPTAPRQNLAYRRLAPDPLPEASGCEGTGTP